MYPLSYSFRCYGWDGLNSCAGVRSFAEGKKEGKENKIYFSNMKKAIWAIIIPIYLFINLLFNLNPMFLYFYHIPTEGNKSQAHF